MISLSGADSKKLLNLLLLYLLYSGALLYFCSPTLGRPLMELFLIASTLSLLWHLPQIWRSPVFFLIGASILIQIASWLYCKYQFPQYAGSNPDIKRLGHLFLFLPIAWVLRANHRSPWVLVSLFFMGLCLAPFTHGGGFEEFLDGERSGFGFRNAEHTALVFAISLVALVVFRKRAFDFFASARAAAAAVLVIAVIYCVSILAITNTRGVLLGLLGGIVAAGIGVLLKSAKPKRRDILVVVALGVIVSISLSMTSNPFDRWMEEVATVKSLVAGDTSNIPKDTSSGIRIHTWAEGWKWFERSPWVGWGENGKNMAIKESSDLPEAIRLEFGHLHNSYLETLVNNGLLGIGLLIALHVWLAATIVKGSRARGIRDVQVFCLIAGVLWLTANFFESFMFYRSGVMIFGIASAALLTASGYRFGASSPATFDEQQNVGA